MDSQSRSIGSLRWNQTTGYSINEVSEENLNEEESFAEDHSIIAVPKFREV